jgi:hypothetical protein
VTKNSWLAAAEVFDGMRIIPRIVLFAALLFVGWYIVWVTRWYMTPEAHSAANATQDSAFAIGVITALGGIVSMIIKFYNDTGRDWSRRSDDNQQDNHEPH